MSQNSLWPSRWIKVDNTTPGTIRQQLQPAAQQAGLEMLEGEDYTVHAAPGESPIYAVATYALMGRRNGYAPSEQLLLRVTLASNILGRAYPTTFVVLEIVSLPAAEDNAIFPVWDPEPVFPNQAAALLDRLAESLAELDASGGRPR
jgi:hypothetical protein